jgi:hypothetical protein
LPAGETPALPVKIEFWNGLAGAPGKKPIGLGFNFGIEVKFFSGSPYAHVPSAAVLKSCRAILTKGMSNTELTRGISTEY